MTLREIINLVLEKVEEKQGDRHLDKVITSAINQSYIFDLSKLDKRLTVSYIPAINGIATLPDDLDTVELITPSLISNERRAGNTIITSRNITFTIIYSIIRDELKNDTDEPELNKKLQFLLILYGAYSYYMYKKVEKMAQFFYQEYTSELARYVDNSDVLGEEVINDIYSNVGDE